MCVEIYWRNRAVDCAATIGLLTVTVAACTDPTRPLPPSASPPIPTLSAVPAVVIPAPNTQRNPAVSGLNVVYIDDEGGQVYVHNLLTGTRHPVTASAGAKEKPAISGTRIVWTDYNTIPARVRYHDLSNPVLNGREVAASTSAQLDPDVEGDWIVWAEPHAIRAYRISSGEVRTLASVDSGFVSASNPAIGGGIVVFQASLLSPPEGELSNWEIFAHNLTSQRTWRVTRNPAAQNNPDVSADLIVWEDERVDQHDIWGYDLAASAPGEFPIATGAETQHEVAVSGKQVVWAEVGATSLDIMRYDHGKPTEPPTAVADGPEQESNPAIEQGCVVWASHWNGSDDIVYSNSCRESAADPRAFDAAFYLSLYSDLRAAFGTDTARARQHWVTQGLPVEGRRGSREFDVRSYQATYPDAGSSYAAALQHWLTAGITAGRRGSPDFDVAFYLARHDDLKALFGANNGAALDHWITRGLPGEGRRGTREFDVQFYLAQYADLRTAYGADYVRATKHWMYTGLPYEGRRGSREVDVRHYLANHADLSAAYGTNYRAAMGHWLKYGLKEGRRASQAFSVKYYLQTYADVQALFGPSNYQGAFDHWVTLGFSEGRSGAP